MKLIKRGEIFKSKGYTQYPTPYMFKDPRDGSDVLRLFYTDREDNKSVPCCVDINPKDLSVLRTTSFKDMLPLGKPGEFDEDGISIQFQSNTTLWYTGYSKGVTVPYKTMIGTAEWTRSGELRKTGLCIGLSRYNPLSVCTPFISKKDNLFNLYYNTHIAWDTESAPKEAMYMINGIQVQDPWSPVIHGNSIFRKAGSDHSYTRPWEFELGNRTIMAYSYRHNYGHREDPSRSYKVGFHDLTNKRAISHDQEGMEQDFMVAYLSVCKVGDKVLGFYNSSYDSGIQYLEIVEE